MDRLLFVDNSTDHDNYRPLEHWKPLFDCPVEVFHAPSGAPPRDIERFSHILLSGSRASTLDEEPWMLVLEEFVRDAIGRGRVVLGSCFGHQLMARALFGRTAVRKRERPQVGWPAMKVLKPDSLLGSEGATLFGFVLHFDEVCEIAPEQAEIILASAECSNLSFRLKDRPAWGIQPHFEIGIVEGLAIIDRVREPGVPEKSRFLAEERHYPRDSGDIIRIAREFIKARPGRGG